MAIKQSDDPDPSLGLNDDIVTEFGGDAPHSISEYYRGGALVPSGPAGNANIPTISTPRTRVNFSDYYGAIADNVATGSAFLSSSTTGGSVSSVTTGTTLYINVGGVSDPDGIAQYEAKFNFSELVFGGGSTAQSYQVTGRNGNVLNRTYTTTSDDIDNIRISADVRITDNNGNTYEFTTGTVTVSNSIPTGGVVIGPDSPINGTTVRFTSISISDPDTGQLLTPESYRWTVNGTQVSTATTYTLNGVAAGSTIVGSVTVRDPDTNDPYTFSDSTTSASATTSGQIYLSNDANSSSGPTITEGSTMEIIPFRNDAITNADGITSIQFDITQDSNINGTQTFSQTRTVNDTSYTIPTVGTTVPTLGTNETITYTGRAVVNIQGGGQDIIQASNNPVTVVAPENDSYVSSLQGAASDGTIEEGETLQFRLQRTSGLGTERRINYDIGGNYSGRYTQNTTGQLTFVGGTTDLSVSIPGNTVAGDQGTIQRQITFTYDDNGQTAASPLSVTSIEAPVGYSASLTSPATFAEGETLSWRINADNTTAVGDTIYWNVTRNDGTSLFTRVDSNQGSGTFTQTPSGAVINTSSTTTVITGTNGNVGGLIIHYFDSARTQEIPNTRLSFTMTDNLPQPIAQTVSAGSTWQSFTLGEADYYQHDVSIAFMPDGTIIESYDRQAIRSPGTSVERVTDSFVVGNWATGDVSGVTPSFSTSNVSSNSLNGFSSTVPPNVTGALFKWGARKIGTFETGTGSVTVTATIGQVSRNITINFSVRTEDLS